MCQRIAAMGLTLLRLDAQGKARILEGSSDPIRLLVKSGRFALSVRKHWAQLCAGDSPLVTLWPGCYLVPCRGPRGTRSNSPFSVLYPVLILGEELLTGEPFADPHTTRRLASSLIRRDEAIRLATTLTWMAEDNQHLERIDSEVNGLSSELAETYEELSLLYKLSTHLTVTQQPARIVAETLDELQQVVGLSWICLALVPQEDRLADMHRWMFVAGIDDRLTDRAKQAADELNQRYAESNTPIIIEDTRATGLTATSQLGINALIVPMHIEGKLIGTLFGGDRLDGQPISSVDTKLCDALSHSLAIFLENHMLYEDAQSMFLGVLHALTRAIDAKDSYTHGHSERVALVARMLAEQIGLDGHTCERIYLAGLVHDVGKIGVPEAVLSKPGRLTDDEFGLIKMHPRIGADILRDIRQMSDLIPGVLYHHERFDGRGYPSRLAGENIPLFGRIIGLADAFDAMSSHRTYRRAMKLPDVLAEMQRCAGSQFDPQLIEPFLKLDLSSFEAQLLEHEHLHTGNSIKAA
jgi:HD-GYP domain-containing protein (c-di-GMP phosphodiesterase class II)